MAGAAPTAALFDLDGTLTDPFIGITRSVIHAMERLGHVAPAADDLRWCIGPPLKSAFFTLLETQDEALADEGVRLYRERYGAIGKFENSVIPGVPEMLDELGSQGCRLFVATSKLSSYAGDILDHFGLSRHFEGIHGSKPDGGHADKVELIRHIMSSESLVADSTVMVGDRMHDVVGANANGVPAVGVLWGYGEHRELSEAGAVRLASRPDELPGIFATMFSAKRPLA